MTDYEDQTILAEYLDFHFPDHVIPAAQQPPLNTGCFPQRTVRESFLDLDLPKNLNSALDLGCSVGRSTFELLNYAKSVVGLDFSHAFIETAKRLQKGETLTFLRKIEGLHHQECHMQWPHAREESVHFVQGDACSLPSDLGDFDLVHAANLLCRLPRPDAFLQRVPHLVKPGGYFTLTTPMTWSTAYTPTENWLGGRPLPDGSYNHTLDSLKTLLSPHFSLEKVWDIPFTIREHQRKFQLTVSQASLWKRM